jgi:ATP-dependent Clp protease ATP-binding subunit ClpA
MIQDLIIAARRMASLYRFKFIQPAHLLHAITANETGRDIISREGYDVCLLRAAMIREFKGYASRIRDAGGHVEPSELFDKCCKSYLVDGDTSYEAGVEAVLKSVCAHYEEDRIVSVALREADMTGRFERLTPDEEEFMPDLDDLLEEDLLDSPKSSVEPQNTTTPTRSFLPPEDEEDAFEGMKSAYEDTQAKSPPVRKKPVEKVTKDVEEARAAVRAAQRDLSDLARKGELDPVVGRDAEIDHVIEVLLRRRKPNVILVAEPGVGKSALVEGLAARLVSKACPDASLAERPVREVSLTSMVAGSRFRGDFESRMSILISEAEKERSILFIDEIHMIVGSGSVARGGMDGANILKPALARDGLSVIGATTPEEALILREDRALMRRFEIVYLAEPGRNQMEEILKGSADKFLSKHNVRITPKVRSKLLDFGERYIEHRRNPDRSFDLLDLAAVSARLRRAEKISDEDLRHAVQRLGGDMPFSSHQKEIHTSDTLDTHVLERVKGHDEAVRGLCGAVEDRSGVMGTRSVIRLIGPEGYGKTTAAESIASFYGKRLVTVRHDELRPDAVSQVWSRISMALEADQQSIIAIQSGSDLLCDEINLRLKAEDHGTGGVSGSSHAPLIISISTKDQSSSMGFGTVDNEASEHITFKKPIGDMFSDLLDHALDNIEIMQRDAGLKPMQRRLLKSRIIEAISHESTTYVDLRKVGMEIVSQM